MDERRRIAEVLLALRLSVLLVMLVWTLDKFVNPGHAAGVYANFYAIRGLGRRSRCWSTSGRQGARRAGAWPRCSTNWPRSTARSSRAKLNVDEGAQLAARFRIQTIPTLILFKDGSPRGRMVGAVPRQQLDRFV